ncbi:hypothetical protein [Frateuria defendens]|uniref:hypothetical protein n=1 Tax=Frateuria defendens TaxID=2219559 RepID=UPI00066FBB60|nr:hypothetical protein [Frateuria defendens]
MPAEPTPEASSALSDIQLRTALAMAEDSQASPAQRAEMLMEIAMGLQQRPRHARQLHDAIALYRRGRELAPPGSVLAARLLAREGTAHQALPDGGTASLRAALDCYEAARPRLAAQGGPAEQAELEMNAGLVLQALAQEGAARMPDALACYQQALRVFTARDYPREFAILHNNLAIAYLSMGGGGRGALREALAMQSFEHALAAINRVDHPAEYAMTQNNLGNALQYLPSSHPLDNLHRAIAAYDEALTVRDRRHTPLEYAHTLANKANALSNLPAAEGAARARVLYGEALDVFEQLAMAGQAATVRAALAELSAA